MLEVQSHWAASAAVRPPRAQAEVERERAHSAAAAAAACRPLAFGHACVREQEGWKHGRPGHTCDWLAPPQQQGANLRLCPPHGQLSSPLQAHPQLLCPLTLLAHQAPVLQLLRVLRPLSGWAWEMTSIC